MNAFHFLEVILRLFSELTISCVNQAFLIAFFRLTSLIRLWAPIKLLYRSCYLWSTRNIDVAVALRIMYNILTCIIESNGVLSLIRMIWNFLENCYFHAWRIILYSSFWILCQCKVNECNEYDRCWNILRKKYKIFRVEKRTD